MVTTKISFDISTGELKIHEREWDGIDHANHTTLKKLLTIGEAVSLKSALETFIESRKKLLITIDGKSFTYTEMESIIPKMKLALERAGF